MDDAPAPTGLCFGIPDVALPRPRGGTVNPATFIGHALLVVFCPTDPVAEAAALEQYHGPNCDLSGYDAWLVVVGQDGEHPRPKKESLAVTAHDPGDAGWKAFVSLAGSGTSLRRDEGATFLFSRGGSLHRVWKGVAPVADIMDGLALTSSCSPDAQGETES